MYNNNQQEGIIYEKKGGVEKLRNAFYASKFTGLGEPSLHEAEEFENLCKILEKMNHRENL